MSEENPRQPRTIDLSMTQLIGGSVAAATAAALSTRLDLVGTIVGAAVASVISTVVAATVSGWLRRARDLTVRREPTRVRGVLVGAVALTLVVLGFRQGMNLLTSDLPPGGVAARLLAELGLSAT